MSKYTIDAAPVSSPAAHASTITVYEDYHSALHEITQPDKLVACSLYFSRRWMPDLGPLGTQIVLILRSLGYYNRKTQELRDGVEIDLPALAALIGVHPATVKREFSRNTYLGKFVTKESQYRTCPITKKPIRTTNVYRVKMDDPLHESDRQKFEETLYARDKGGRKAQIAPYSGRTTEDRAQFVTGDVQVVSEAVQTVSKRVQSVSENVQNAPTLKDYSYLPQTTKNTKTTSLTPPALKIEGATPQGGDFSPSLSPEKETKQQEPDQPNIRRRAQRQVFKRVQRAPPCAAVLEQMIQARMGEIQAEDAAKEAAELCLR